MGHSFRRTDKNNHSPKTPNILSENSTYVPIPKKLRIYKNDITYHKQCMPTFHILPAGVMNPIFTNDNVYIDCAKQVSLPFACTIARGILFIGNSIYTFTPINAQDVFSNLTSNLRFLTDTYVT